MISNSQLLEMREFKYCPFKKFLPKALKLQYMREEDTRKRKLKYKNTIKEDDDDEENLEERPKSGEVDAVVSMEDDNKLAGLQKEGGNGKLLLNENKAQEEKNLQNNLTTLNNPIKPDSHTNRDNETDNMFLLDRPYITFTKFCNILKVFNPNYPVDAKIRCKLNMTIKFPHLNYFNWLVYFKLFDIDGDGRISKTDLKMFLFEIFPEDLEALKVKQEKDEAEEKNIDVSDQIDNKADNPESNEHENIQVKENETESSESVDYDKLIEIVFGEIIFNEKRKYLDYDDFSHVLWTTTIDKTCVIDFENAK